jgi:Restriction endonuclease NotI
MSFPGNFVAEWFGHRVYPGVTHAPEALADQRNSRCPFLSSATGEERQCIKTPSAFGVCTISNSSNSPRQDWIVCPYRAVEPSLLSDAVERLFGPGPSSPRLIVPAPALLHEDVRATILAATARGESAIVFFQDKLGGEISLARTQRSPELSFDITLVEIRNFGGDLPDVGRYGILEVQTMDFHGSYRSAVQNLQDALRLHADGFPEALEKNSQWLGERIEGPNVANVFKRTFYQIMLKFQIGSQESCTGCILALPQAVWDSWQRHLGGPEVTRRPDGDFELKRPGTESGAHPPAWIYVFDIEAESPVTPNPIVIRQRIATDTDSIAYFALKVAPEAAIGQGGSADLVPAQIKRRLSIWWPQFGVLPPRRL